jgi:hypothetical protein
MCYNVQRVVTGPPCRLTQARSSLIQDVVIVERHGMVNVAGCVVVLYQLVAILACFPDPAR